jgi:small subunit ribosomal protein S14
MSTNAKEAKFRRQMAALDKHKAEVAKPADQQNPANVLEPRERIKIRLRCKLCGRGRAVYRKFGVCRICFRDMASNGVIPGVRKASW